MIKILDIEKAILMLILFSIAILGYEVQFMSYVLSAIVVGYFMLKGELKLSRYGVLIPLILLLILGTRIGAGFRLVDIVRDYIYFSSPILSFLLGVILYKRISFQKLMILFVAFGTFYSLYYLLQSTLQFGSIFISDTYDTRYSIGTGTPMPMMALFFMIFFYKDINMVFRNHYLLLGIILFNAFVMYYFASRVYYFSFLIFILLYLLMVSFCRATSASQAKIGCWSTEDYPTRFTLATPEGTLIGYQYQVNRKVKLKQATYSMSFTLGGKLSFHISYTLLRPIRIMGNPRK